MDSQDRIANSLERIANLLEKMVGKRDSDQYPQLELPLDSVPPVQEVPMDKAYPAQGAIVMDLEEMKSHLMAFTKSENGSKEIALEIMGMFGAKKASDVAEEDRAELVKLLYGAV